MPQGIEFVRTKPNTQKKVKLTKRETNKDEKKEEESNEEDTTNEDHDNDEVSWDDSCKVIFRLTSAEVARKFWQMYESEELEVKLRGVLAEGTLLRLNMLDGDGEVKVNLKIFEDKYQVTLEFFEGTGDQFCLKS